MIPDSAASACCCRRDGPTRYSASGEAPARSSFARLSAESGRFVSSGRFINDVECVVPASKLMEAVVDNYATHKHPKVKA
jgi:hypothetical protein